MPRSGAWRLYAALTTLLAPVFHARDARRLRRAGVSEARIAERRGRPTLPHFADDPIWLHAVSVGEVQSVLPLAGRLAQSHPVLITTTSPTSARLVAERLPGGCVHQFAPLDTPVATRRFFDHWRPRLAVLTESELWPRQITEARARGIPVALVGARLSDRSIGRWGRAPGLAREVMGGLSLVLAQDERTARGLVALGLHPERCERTGTLKSAAPPLPADPETLAALRAALLGRRAWLAASTHPGEDEAVIAAHRALLVREPSLLLILAPRHAERGDTMAAMLREAGLNAARRSTGEAITPERQVYLADTLGEMGLWFRLTNTAFMGASLVDLGGHNPLEPVQLGARAIAGPHVTNFTDIYAELEATGAARRIDGAPGLAPAVSSLLDRADAPAPPPGRADMIAATADRLLALGRTAPTRLEIVAPNFKRRLSGVTATIVRLVPLQAHDLGIRAAGPALPQGVPHIPLWHLPFLPYRPLVWHARRNTEMIGGLALKVLLGKRLRLIFTSASQRRHTGLTRRLIRRMDAVVATSAKSAAYLERPARVIAHGIDTAAFAPATDRAALRARLGLPPGGPLIGCYGRIRAQKGTDVFVDAMRRALPDHPGATALVMGRALPKEAVFAEGLKERARTSGLGERILFLPERPVTEMADWYAALDLYVAPQRWEGFGLTPLEAMACGVPVVAARVGAFDELVADGRTGRLVPPDDPDAMAAAVAQVLGADMGRAARAHVAETFTLRGEADALNALYRDLLRPGGVPAGAEAATARSSTSDT